MTLGSGYGGAVPMPQLWFASPRVLPRADKLQGRVVVLDIAFAATVGTTVSFELVTKPFLDGLGTGSPRGSITTITSGTPSSRAIRGSCCRRRPSTARVPRW